MAGHLTSRLPPLSPGVTTYFTDVEAGIPTWCRSRDSLLTELAEGLTDTAEHYLTLGVSRPEAERRASTTADLRPLSPTPSPNTWSPGTSAAPPEPCCSPGRPSACYGLPP